MDDALGWVVALSISFVAFRYFFGGSEAAPGPRRRRVVSPAQIDQVTAMFPHIPLPAVRFELERTGSVETTVERILRDGRLPEPPAGFFVDPFAPAPPAPVAPTPAAAPTKPTTPASLITRLGLQSRAAAASQDAPVLDNTEGKGKGKVGWETNPEARERNLKERKERMVLEARRKLLERERERKAASAAGSSGL